MIAPVVKRPAVRLRPALLAFGLVLITLAVVTWTSSERHGRDAARLVASPVCEGSASTGCRTVVATTVATVTKSGKHDQVIEIKEPSSVAGDYTFWPDAAVLSGAQAGSTISAELWDGEVVALSDDGGFSYTSDAPMHAQDVLMLVTIVLAALALSVLLKCALGATALAEVPSVRNLQWIVDITSWRSIVYNVSLFVTVAALFTLLESTLEGWAGPADPPVGMLAFIFAVVAAGITMNTVYTRRTGRDAATALRRQRSIPRAITLCVLVILAVSGTIAAISLAFTTQRQIAAANAITHAPACSSDGQTDCLHLVPVEVSQVDTTSPDPAIYVDDAAVGAQWIRFAPDERAFVQTVGQLTTPAMTVENGIPVAGPATTITVMTFNGDVVAVQAPDAYPVRANLPSPPPFLGTVAAGAATLVLIAAGVTVGWRRPGVFRMVAAVGLVAGAMIGVDQGRSWSPWAVIVACVLVCWPRVSRRPATSAVTPASLPAHQP